MSRSISGTTRLAGVIGWPLDHTLSPIMHNAVYERLGLNWVYLPFEFSDEIGLRRFMALAPSLRCVGFNVTMPFKQAALELCDEVAMAANMAGAVNTVHVVDGRLVGYNTDGRGLLETLENEAGFAPAGKRVVIGVTGEPGAGKSALAGGDGQRVAAPRPLVRPSGRPVVIAAIIAPRPVVRPSGRPVVIARPDEIGRAHV